MGLAVLIQTISIINEPFSYSIGKISSAVWIRKLGLQCLKRSDATDWRECCFFPQPDSLYLNNENHDLLVFKSKWATEDKSRKIWGSRRNQQDTPAEIQIHTTIKCQ